MASLGKLCQINYNVLVKLGTKVIESINFKLRTTETLIDISPNYPYDIFSGWEEGVSYVKSNIMYKHQFVCILTWKKQPHNIC